MHSISEYQFKTESEATEFVENRKANKSPIEDLYIHGPFFVDESEVFKNMSFTTKSEKYWSVRVESYS